MERKPVKARRKVTVLTDPMPVFNSIVEAGANGTPLRVIKTDDHQEPQMTKTIKTGNADISRLTFKADKFPTEDAVKAWLTAGGYEETAIKSEEGAFVVESGKTFTETSEIEVEDGVVALVGTATEEVDTTAKADVTEIEGQAVTEPTTGAQKSAAELRALKDSTMAEAEWDALSQQTRDKYIKIAEEALASEGAAETDEETVQPVAPEASTKTELPALLVKGEDGVLRVSAEKGSCWRIEHIAEVISSLNYLKNDAQYDAYFDGTATDAAFVESVKAVIRQLGEILIAASAAYIETATKADVSEPAQKSEGEISPTVEAATAAETTETAPASITDPTQLAVLETLKGLTELVGSMKAEITTVKDEVKQSADKAAELAQRMEQVEGTSQTRKSADVEDLTPVTQKSSDDTQKTTAEISAEVRKRSAAEAMGLRA